MESGAAARRSDTMAFIAGLPAHLRGRPLWTADAMSAARRPKNPARRRAVVASSSSPSSPPSSPSPLGDEKDAPGKSATATRAAPNPPPIYYDFDPADVEAVKVRHVLVESETLADELMAAIRAGQTSLADVASTLSLCDSSRHKRGDLGWHERDGPVGVLADDFAAAAFATRVNHLGRVRTSQGWHVYMVEDARHRLRARVSARPTVPSRTQLAPHRRHAVASTEPHSYHVLSMGCQMNQADSERMAGELEAAGLHRVEDSERASVLVVNTCSIRDHAEQKVYSYLGRHARRKWLDPSITLVVAGCVAQQEGERLLRRVPELDVVMGPQYVNRLAEMLDCVRQGHQLVATEPVHIMEDLSKPRRASPAAGAAPVTAWVNVIYGCNERCTYCVVPSVRGLEQSRSRAAIRAEVEALAAQGVREVVLLGQNIDAYGRDLRPRDTFTDLLYAIHDVPGIERIRFTTSHPRYMTERLVRACAQLPKVCEYFHVPFQSGDNGVLRNMRRGYTVERFERICELIRTYLPDASVSADAIVAFPGETEEQFENTLRLIRAQRFDTVHTAAYSPRPNTPAAEYGDQLPEEVKDRRLRVINDVTAEVAAERSRRYLGRVEEVLVEDRNQKNPAQVYGRTRTNRLTFFEGDAAQLRGKLVPVLITQARAFSLTGEIASEPR